MTTEELKRLEQTYSESKIQHTCVSWFRKTFTDMAHLLYAIPNGGYRTPRGGAMLRYEGALSGVADLCLALPRKGKGALYIEMKTPKMKGSSAGRQSDNQKQWQKVITDFGNEYRLCHGLVEFVSIICEYLDCDPQPHIFDATNKYPCYL